MPRYNQLDRVRYNSLGSVQYNVQHRRIDSPLYQRLPRARPVLLRRDGRRVAVLEQAYDMQLVQEVNGEDTLTFLLPFRDAKRTQLQNDMWLQLVDDIYVVRRLEDSRDDQGRPTTMVYAEALWYDLQFADPLDVNSWTNQTPDVAMADILAGTGWSVGTVEVTTRRNLKVDPNLMNRLRALREVQEIWGGELRFNSSSRTVDLLSGEGAASGVVVAYRKNAKQIQRVESTEDLVTRLYLYGKGGISIADVNGGVPYLENYQYTNEVRVRAKSDERFTNQVHLLEYGKQLLNELSKPQVSYLVQAADLSALSGWAHEAFHLGDTVTVYDEELGIHIQTRIVRWTYNVLEPWETVLELSSVRPGLSDVMARMSEVGETLQATDTASRQDLANMMVYNYLRNSRGVNGTAYWVNQGWEIDGEEGVSTHTSFRCQGQLGVEKSLSQTVWPAHRDAYTISYEAAVENLVKGPGARVGVEIVMHYTDGTSETVFLPLT